MYKKMVGAYTNIFNRSNDSNPREKKPDEAVKDCGAKANLWANTNP